ncbi:hypothetical protein C1645_816733 [Glomus cerebriforme]|uniref:Uncharacterized protein n=1 Tax=Glomus cerebriforme TaxID=658196 RepID=A0A397TFZ4_9GLOM|nr:hypothetical protein C1645_816733 [Glomus cerebriforme]
MEKRNNDIYEAKCPRCRKEDETWTHIWTCEKNEVNILQIIKEEINNQITKLNEENIIVNKEKWNNIIIEVLTRRSNYIKDGYIFHEIIKGIFNNNLYKIAKEKQIIDTMEQLILTIATKAKDLIWNNRCSQVTELEKKRGLTRMDKRKSKSNNIKDIEEKNKLLIEKSEKINMIIQLTNRWIGSIIESNKNYKDIWYKESISDIINR